MLRKSLSILLVLIAPLAASFGKGTEGRPVLTTAGIVHVGEDAKIALIERGKAPWGLALFGGHVENESPEDAFMRELNEELNIDQENVFNFSLIGVHGKPGRDFRQHSVEATYVCCTHQMPVAGSDAKSVTLYSVEEVRDLVNNHPERFAFDHGDILKAYLEKLGSKNPAKAKMHYALAFEN